MVPELPSVPPAAAQPPAPWPGERSRLAEILGHRRNPGPPAPTSGPVPPVSPGPLPSSAPPYPYEGDLDDTYGNGPRAAVPMARPDWVPAAEPTSTPPAPAERSRHALVTDTLAQGLPQVETPSGENPAAVARPTYDSGGYQRRYEPAPAAFPPATDDVSPFSAPAAYPPAAGRPDEPGAEPDSGLVAAVTENSGALPQRVPAQPDVPRVPEPPSVEPSAEAPALARIATHLRRGDVVPAQERQEGFDVQDILAAVREVAGVRDASLRATPAGAHSLRLDLSDGADPAEVSRRVARLLQERMGLDAAMPADSPLAPIPAAPTSAPPIPGQTRSGRASVPAPAKPAPAKPAPATPVSATPVSAVPAPAKPVSAPPQLPPAPVSTPPAQRSSFVERASLVPVDASRPRPLDPGDSPGPRVVIENVHVNTFGADASVEVRLRAGGRAASGVATGPAVDGYLLRLCATATAGAVDELLSTSQNEHGPARCFVEHAASVSFGQMQVAVVVLLLSCDGGWVEQLAGSAVVTGDDRHAMVRATLAAVNRRLEALLA
ncbi:Daple [Actinoplanes sp. OR16]|uniref:Daple n=1 Tax=Actinoplanes sp. OR16 TaxID=946334 RepID=UPI001E39B289|nr:Daple [Actinoplanes sp. OR16]